jgi:hypothetical protein
MVTVIVMLYVVAVGEEAEFVYTSTAVQVVVMGVAVGGEGGVIPQVVQRIIDGGQDLDVDVGEDGAGGMPAAAVWTAAHGTCCRL